MYYWGYPVIKFYSIFRRTFFLIQFLNFSFLTLLWRKLFDSGLVPAKEGSCLPPPTQNGVPGCRTPFGDEELQSQEQSILFCCVRYDLPAGLLAGWQRKPQRGEIWGIWALSRLCIFILAKCHGHILVPAALPLPKHHPLLTVTEEEIISTSLL